MKKLSLVLLVLVIAALLGLPGLLGKLAQSEIDSQLDLTAGNPVLAVSIADYDRGWFSSKVRYEIGFTDEYLKMIESAVANKDGKNMNSLDESLLEILSPFELISEVSHGPVGVLDGPFFGLFKSLTTEGENNPRLNEFLNEANMPYLVKGNSTTSLLGSTTFNFEMPAASDRDDGEQSDSLAGKLIFSGATGQGSYTASKNDGRRIKLSGRIDNLSVKDDESEFTMNAVTVNTDAQAISEMLWIGPVRTSFGALIVKDRSSDDPVSMTMQNMNIDIDSAYGSSKDTVDMKMIYRIDGIEIDGQAISDVEFAVGMTEMSVPAFEKYNEWVQNVAFTQSQEPDAQEEMLAAMVPILHEFISKSPSISIDPVQLSANNENFLANLTLNIDGSNLPPLENFDAMDPAMWMQMVSGKAGLKLSENMAQLLAVSTAQSQLQTALGDQQEITPQQINEMAVAQAPILIQTLVQQGMLQSADGQISAGINYANGELLLNGQPIPLGDLLGM